MHVPQTALLDRFVRYVQIDTQSDPHSNTFPSTQKQKDLARLLVQELLELGCSDAHMDEWGYVFATVPGNSSRPVPVIRFCAHMDTSPDCSGAQVKPLIHRNYQGQPLVLPDDPSQILTIEAHPDLAQQIGGDVVTASGTTLLGADNKAGVAIIMDAVQYWMSHPQELHGDIRILFTPDEEIGRGVDKLDMEKLAADFGYTVDGETRGSIEDETFSADSMRIDIQGVSVHPGFAKGRMQSALKVAAQIITQLPAGELSPETTQGREGFIHPVGISGTVESASLEFIIRDFDDQALKAHGDLLLQIAESVVSQYENCSFTAHRKEQYRNMKNVLSAHPEVAEIATEAIQRSGMQPVHRSIRGGTDGSRLSFMGLPCPNIFAGEHAFHGKQEWVSLQDMELSVLTLRNIARIWEERS